VLKTETIHSINALIYLLKLQNKTEKIAKLKLFKSLDGIENKAQSFINMTTLEAANYLLYELNFWDIAELFEKTPKEIKAVFGSFL
jgi:hypothetical protein